MKFPNLKKYFRAGASEIFLRGAGRRFSALFLCLAFFLVLSSVLGSSPEAFGAPTQTPGVGSGAIGVDTTTNNLSIGTAAPAANSKLLITGGTNDTTTFGLRVTQANGTDVLMVRSDGSITIGTNTFSAVPGLSVNGSIYSSGPFTGTIGAQNISQGVFSNNIAGGPFNFAFPGSLGVGYASQVGLPQPLSVAGNAYISGNVGIGTASPGDLLDISAYSPFMRFTRNTNSGGYVAGQRFVNYGGAAGFWSGINGSGGNASYYSVKAGDYNGTVGLAVSTLGNVGIGTAAPGQKLEVAGNVSSTGLCLDGTCNTTWPAGGLAGGGTVNYVGKFTGTGTIGNSLIFDNGTNVGIGLINPTAKLTIGGTAGVDGIKFPDGTLQTTAVGAGASLWAANGTNISNTNSGNVGIGTASPGTRLEIQDYSPRIRIKRNTDTGSYIAGIEYSNNAGNSGSYIYMAPNAVTIGGGFYEIGNSPYMTILGGNVGIGTTSPGSPLTINTAVQHTIPQLAINFNPSNPGCTGCQNIAEKITNTDATGNSKTNIGLWVDARNAANNYAALFENGNVGIGTANPEAKLHVSGGGILLDNSPGNLYPSPTSTNLIFKDDVGNLRSVLGLQSPFASINILNFGDFSVIPPSSLYMRYNAAGAAGTHTFFTNRVERLRIDAAGNVGIGTTPAYKLDVASAGATTARFGTAAADTVVVGGGSGKITAGTFDPLYNIGGAQYATYLPGMTGQKEETTGLAKLEQMANGEWQSILDFKNVERGSDLWLFSQITDFGENWEKLTALLTPNFNGRVWYKKDNKNFQLKIFASPVASSQLLDAGYEVSYRLTAPRFDAGNWPNASKESGGFVVPEK